MTDIIDHIEAFTIDLTTEEPEPEGETLWLLFGIIGLIVLYLLLKDR